MPAWRPFLDIAECLLSFQDDGREADRELLHACVSANQSRGLLFVLPDLKAREARVMALRGEIEAARNLVEEGIRLTAEGERFQLPGLLHASALINQYSEAPSDETVSAFEKAIATAHDFKAHRFAELIQRDLNCFLDESNFVCPTIVES